MMFDGIIDYRAVTVKMRREMESLKLRQIRECTIPTPTEKKNN